MASRFGRRYGPVARLRDPGHGQDNNFGISRKSKPRLRTHEMALSLASTYMHY